MLKSLVFWVRNVQKNSILLSSYFLNIHSMRVGINLKIIILALLLVVIPSTFIGVVGYQAAKMAYFNGINDRLKDQAKDWELLVDTYNKEIEAQELRARRSAESIVSAQAKMTYELINHAIHESGGNITPEKKEELFSRLNRNAVGKTGYTWILDYKGNYILSKGRQRDGENIWDTKDADGNLVIQKLIADGKTATSADIVYDSYMWLDRDEISAREKIVAMIHFPELGWVVGVSTYYDDLVDMGYRTRTIEHVKDLMSRQHIGVTGYIWVVNSKGVYQVSKNRLRDGEDISQSKDANGNLFIQEAIGKAKEAGVGGQDLVAYPWKNKDETKSRLKVSGLSYNKNLDWVIGVSAYYDEFRAGDLRLVRNYIVAVLLLATFISIIIALIFANRISSPLRKINRAGRKIASGDLSAEIPESNSGDEVEDLSETMSMLVGAIKFLRKDKKK